MYRSGNLRYGTRDASLAAGTSMRGEKSRTQQQFKDETDIKVIVKNFTRTGLAPMRTAVPLPGDFHEVFDFQSAQNLLVRAKQAFMELPSGTRKRFGHDPAEFVAFVANPENGDELVKLGLGSIRPAPVETVQKVEIVNPVAPAAPEPEKK